MYSTRYVVNMNVPKVMRKRPHQASPKSGYLIGFVQNDEMRLTQLNGLIARVGSSSRATNA